MKKILGFIILLFMLSINTNASSNYIDFEKNAYYDEDFGAYVVKLSDETVNDNSIDISRTSSFESFSTSSDIIIEPSSRPYYEYWKYTATSKNYKVNMKTIKASADISCTSTKGCLKSITGSGTASETFSVTLSGEKAAIRANAGFTWNKSLSNSETNSFSLKYGEKGYVAFTPYGNKTNGNIQKCNNWTGCGSKKSANATSPRKLSNGLADGNFYWVYIVKK